MVDANVTRVKLSEKLTSVEERSLAINGVLRDLQQKELYPCLKGWRNEVILHVAL